VFVGPALAAGYQLWKTRRLDERWVRFFAGAALAVALLVPASLQVGGGMQAYRRFAQNTAKHKETPLTNYMGLRTVVAYRPSEAGHILRNDRFTDPWIQWKEARLRGYRQALPVYYLVALLFLALLALAVKGRPYWQAAALGVMFIPFGVELTCYYYAFIIAVALLHAEDERVGRLLLLLTAFTGVVDWAPAGLPTWLDEKYTLMSVGTLLVFFLIAWDFGPLPALVAARRAARRAAATAPSAGEPVAVKEPKVRGGGGAQAAAAAPAPQAEKPWLTPPGARKKKKRRS
jgi:hypothetical protein